MTIMNDETREFVAMHRNEDVRELALKAKRVEGLDLPLALDQIAGWQIARTKTATMGLLRGNRIPSTHFHGTVLIAVHSPIQVRNRTNTACAGRNRARQSVRFWRIGQPNHEK